MRPGRTRGRLDPSRPLSDRRQPSLIGRACVAALTIAGAVGIEPLPGYGAGRGMATSGNALGATQPGVRRSLLDLGGLPPGFAAAPDTPVAGADTGTDPGSSATPAS